MANWIKKFKVGTTDYYMNKTASISLGTTGWSNNSKTVNVEDMTANATVIVSPAPTSIEEWTDCGLYCSAQASGSLTFTYTEHVPTSALTINLFWTEA